MRSLLKSKWSRVWIVALSGSLIGVAIAADEKTGTNRTEADTEQSAQKSPAADAVSQLGLSYSLVHYGRANKSPLALLTAAEILHRHPTADLGVSPKTEAGTGKKPDNATAKQEKPAVTAEGLIAEAKTLAAGNDRLLELVADVAAKVDEASRGAVGGAKQKITKVNPFATDSYTISFRGGEVAAIVVSGDGDTDLDLYVYDQNGNLIAADDDNSDDCLIRFIPKWTGPFTVRVRNRGWVYNQYVLATN